MEMFDSYFNNSSKEYTSFSKMWLNKHLYQSSLYQTQATSFESVTTGTDLILLKTFEVDYSGKAISCKSVFPHAKFNFNEYAILCFENGYMRAGKCVSLFKLQGQMGDFDLNNPRGP